MTLEAVSFRCQRLALVGGIQTEIFPPLSCQSVTVSNATSDYVRIITDVAGLEYIALAPNFERVIWLPQPGSLFRQKQIAFWLQAVADGTVILTWA